MVFGAVILLSSVCSNQFTHFYLKLPTQKHCVLQIFFIFPEGGGVIHTAGGL